MGDLDRIGGMWLSFINYSPPMTPPFSQTVSVIKPLKMAIERVKEILFRPFDLEKWIAITFCAWLATGGGIFSFNSFNNRKTPDLNHLFGQAK